MLNSLFAVIAACFIACTVQAQLPSCDIYHFSLSSDGDDLRLTQPKFLTGFNSEGYNNQPLFFEDDLVYFTTNYFERHQTEIASFDLAQNILSRVTYTDESEYSPTPVPGSDEFSTVRVEKNGDIQTLMVYPLDGIGYPRRLLNNIINIGYHVWLDTTNLGIFLVEAPHHNLAIADAGSERRLIILDNIGRTMKVDEAGRLLFVHKINEDAWYIKSYNKEINQSTVVAKTLPGAEDFELLNDGTILMASGSKIYSLKPGTSTGWNAVIDLDPYNIHNIQRIATRKNRLVLVNQTSE